MPKKSLYSFEQLVEIYRRYAQLKGWSTKAELIRDKVQAWMDSSIGPVGLAIEYHETRRDGAKDLGHDAEARAANAPIQTIVARLAGVEHANSDGSSRAAIIRKCAPFEILPLRPEPKNKYDPNAIAVLRQDGTQIGYLPRHLAAQMVAEAHLGCRYVAAVQSIDTGDNQLGVIPEANIVVFRVKPGVSNEDLQAYYDSWVREMKDR